jgi:hypothetical protein
VSYDYALLAMMMYGGKFQFLQNYDTPFWTFNSAWDAFLTLFGLFLGNGSTSVLLALLDVGSLLSGALIFISYTLLVGG